MSNSVSFSKCIRIEYALGICKARGEEPDLNKDMTGIQHVLTSCQTHDGRNKRSLKRECGIVEQMILGQPNSIKGWFQPNSNNKVNPITANHELTVHIMMTVPGVKGHLYKQKI